MRRISALTALLAGISLAGCAYSRVAWPPDDHAAKTAVSRPEIKVSYTIRDVFVRPKDKEPKRERPVESALLAVLRENGIEDAISSEWFEPERLNIIVYQFEGGPTLGNRLLFPLWMVSGASFFLLPLEERTSHPLEVHIIDPKRDGPARFQIRRVKWILDHWVWHGFGLFKPFVKDDSARYGAGPTSTGVFQRLETTGIKRALRPVIAEALARASEKPL
jgi:hypothetical protein